MARGSFGRCATCNRGPLERGESILHEGVGRVHCLRCAVPRWGAPPVQGSDVAYPDGNAPGNTREPRPVLPSLPDAPRPSERPSGARSLSPTYLRPTPPDTQQGDRVCNAVAAALHQGGSSLVVTAHLLRVLGAPPELVSRVEEAKDSIRALTVDIEFWMSTAKEITG